MTAAAVIRTSAFASMASSTWGALQSDGTFDITITAAAGDVIEVGVSMLSPSASGAYNYADAATMVSGSPVNWISSGSGSHASGVSGWITPSILVNAPVSGSVLYTVQSGDVVSGQVTLRFYAKTNTSTRAWVATSTDPAMFWAVSRYAPPAALSITDATATASAAAHTETLLIPLAITDATATAAAAAHTETVAIGVAITDDTATAAAAAHTETVSIPLTITDSTATASAAAHLETITGLSGLEITDTEAASAAAAHDDTVHIAGESLATIFDTVTVEDLLYVSLTPDTDLDVSVPILRESHPSPTLTEANPTYQEWVDYTPVTEPVGFPHIWVDDVDVTYFRGSPTIVRNWTREMPWGDKTAAWEMPQLHPWDTAGEGDLTWLRRGARVVIGIVDLEGNIDEKWSGRYHARTKGLDERHDWVFEAKGSMWAAMDQLLEPVPYQPPVDIGRLIPRLLNKLIGRSFNPIPETVTGIMTRYRGARDERVWQAVQNILAREAWTDDGRQWSLVQVARDEFRLQLKKPMDEVTATVAYGNPGVDFELSVDEDSAVDHVFCRWVNPGGGESANVFYPGLELLNGLPYPNADAGEFLNLGTTDADTDSGTGVTDWQTKVRSLGYTTLAVTGVMSSAWVSVVRDVQDALDLTVDGSIGPQTWTASFTAVLEDVDLTPRRLPMAKKGHTWPWVDGANGAILGDNPDFDGMAPIQVPLDMGTNITRGEVARAARTYLAVHGTAVVSGSVRFRGCPDNMARTDLTVGDNLEIRGHEGSDIVVQLSRMSVDVTADDVSAVYAVTFDADERARDALTIDQILERNREALADPARRPGNPNRTSRNVRDEGFSWDADSPCGKLTRTAVNGDTGLWSRRVIPFAEIGQLAGIRLRSTVPFAMVLMASLRFTENMALDVIGDPFASTDPYRPVWDQLEEFGILGAWGAQDDACGYSPGKEGDGYDFTGKFVEATTLEYVTEGPTAPYVSVLLFARGDSGFVWGDAYGEGFLPARQT